MMTTHGDSIMQTATAETGLSIAAHTLGTTIDVLTQALSDEHLLYIKLRNCHWNVEGPHFLELHALFEEQYEMIAASIDRVAERMRALGAKAVGTMTEYLHRTALVERPGEFPTAKHMLCDLLEDHGTVIRFIRTSLASSQNNLDVGSIDLLTVLLKEHEKMAWIVRATLSENFEDRQLQRPERLSVLYE
jgi:starvation-inducible DNA-binding protein